MAGAAAKGFVLAGRYRLLGSLGRGGMGIVWHARDEVLGREVAVKEILLPPDLPDEERAVLRRRTLREARSAAQLSHPNVVAMYDVVEEEGRPWIVMELVRSRTLAEVVQEEGPLSVRRVAHIGLQMLGALQAAHAVGVLHRDVKPSNVLVGDHDRVVLTDFGIATLEGDASLTQSGTLVGSPAYIAPERVKAKKAGPESDLWSLGATLYAAVEGRPPHDRGSALATLTAAVTEAPDPAPRAGPLWPVLEGLLRKDPADRLTAPAAVRLLVLALRDEQSAQAVGSGRPPARDRRWIPKVLAVLAACLVVGGVLVGWDVLKPDDDVQTQSPGTTTSTSPRGGSASPAPRSTPSGSGSRAPSSRTSPPPFSTSPPPTSAPSNTRRPSQPSSNPPALPAGFRRHNDPTGFSLPVPSTWTAERQNGRVYFREPGGSRLLLIDQTNSPKPDPVADWRRQEQARRDTYDDYRRIRIEPVDYFRGAADWEFTYAVRGGRQHVLNRGVITSPTQAYGIYWSTPESQWTSSRSLLSTITRNFRPAS
jgi:eukaryotic-like serine/threonine-protein kinase